MRTFAIIPVRDQWHLTERVLACLQDEDVKDVLVMDNGSTDGTGRKLRTAQQRKAWKGRLRVMSTPTLGVYEMWNLGFARARRLASGAPFEVLVLNNDIELPRGWVKFLQNALLSQQHDVWISYPDVDAAWVDDARTLWCELKRTRGVFGDGGMFGPCFMLAGDQIRWSPLVDDPAYQWWWGDNHLAECVEQAGGEQVRVVGLPIRHENEGTAKLHPELEAVKWEDRQAWLTRHVRR